MTSWMVPLLLSLEDEFQILIHLTTEQFSSLIQSILNELWSRENSTVSGSCSHVASSLHDGALTCICGGYAELCSQTVISGSVPEPMQWFNDRITSVFKADLPEGPKITDIQDWTSSVSLVHSYVSFSHSFFKYHLFFQPFVAPAPTFLRHTTAIKFKMSLALNIQYVFYVLLWTTHWLMIFEHRCIILFLFTFYTAMLF